MQEVLRKLRAKLTRLARTAEDFRSMASPDWAPRVGAYINAAHWMSHSLQEAAGPLLLLDLEGMSHSGMPEGLGQPLQQRVDAQVSTGYRSESPACVSSASGDFLVRNAQHCGAGCRLSGGERHSAVVRG